MSKSSFLERNQKPYDSKRTQIIEMFVAKAGDKLAEVTAAAEKFCMKEGKSFERSLADALDQFKIH